MKHVSRYCTESKKDVTTPADVVEALNSCGGVANCTAEMVHLRRDHVSMRRWVSAQEKRELAKLGRVNEFAYSQAGGGKWIVKCYPLSGRDFSEYEFGELYSKRVGGAGKRNTDEEELVETGRNELQNNSYLSLAAPKDVSYQSTVTGITVWAGARLRRQKRRRKIRPERAIEDTEELLSESVEDDKNEHEQTPENAVILECEKCRKLYRIEKAFAKHSATCTDGSESNRVIDRARRFAIDMMGTPDAAIYTTKNLHPSTLAIEISQKTRDDCQLKPGWAQRPAYGSMLGENFAHRYAAELKEWFDIRAVDKGKKLSVSRMRELLKMKYRERYDIPGEHNIITFISALLPKSKKNQVNPKNITATAMDFKRRGVPAQYDKKLNQLLNADPNLMLRKAREALLALLQRSEENLAGDFPTEAAIKNKVFSLKAQRKKQTRLDPTIQL